MDRQATFLLALGLLIAAAAIVSVSGWALFVRDRHAGRPAHEGGPASVGAGANAHHEAVEER
jgi:hypothetical protein